MNDFKMPIKTLNEWLDRGLAGVAERVRSAKDENATPTIVIEDQHSTILQEPPTEYRVFQSVVLGVRSINVNDVKRIEREFSQSQLGIAGDGGRFVRGSRTF
jgi:hypothetical protein